MPSYLPGSTQVELSTLGPVDRWTEVDYAFPPGILGDWAVAPESDRVVQTADGGMTFFVSDADMTDGEFVSRITVEQTGGDDDYVGLVFGFQQNTATGLPDQYYLVSWKQSAENGAEEGLKLAKVTGTGVAGQRPDLWDLQSGDPHIEILDTSPSTGWQDQTPYEFRIGYQTDGTIDLAVRRASDGELVWTTQVVDAAPLGPGKIGFYNFGQASARYEHVNNTASLRDGYYQLVVASGDTGIRDLEGEPLDGDGDGAGGDDFVHLFGVDAGQASVAIDLQAASDTGASAEDNITKIKQPVFDVSVTEAGRIEVDFNGDGSADASLVVEEPGTYPFTASYATDAVYTARASFLPVSGGIDPVTATIQVTIDTLRPQLAAGENFAVAPWSSYVVDFSEAIDPATFVPADLQLSQPGGALLPVDSVVGQNARYTLSFAEQSALGKYTLSVGPGIADLAGNTMSAAALRNVYVTTADEQSALLVNVNGSYNTDGWNLYQTLLGRRRGPIGFSSTPQARSRRYCSRRRTIRSGSMTCLPVSTIT